MTRSMTHAELLHQATQGDPEAQYALAGALHRHGRREEAHVWLRKAAQAEHALALCTLGTLLLDGRELPRQLDEAESCLAKAARKGVSDAELRLAELYGFEAFGHHDLPRSHRHLQQAARAGQAAACRLLGFLEAEQQHWQQAQALFGLAAQAGDGPACHALGLCHLLGLGIEARPAHARHWFELAAQRGQARARHYLASLTTPPDAPPAPPTVEWPDLHHPEHPGPTAKVLREAPFIAITEQAYSPLECDYLINIAVGRTRPSLIVEPDTGLSRPNPIRSSSHLTLDPSWQDLLLERLESRQAALAGIAQAHAEFQAILHYLPGQEYRAHYDYFDPGLAGPGSPLREAGQRIQTQLVYLNDDFSGGATFFHRLELAITPVRGCLLHFHNVDPQGLVDPLTLHSGQPVISGGKWLASKWLRERPYRARTRW